MALQNRMARELQMLQLDPPPGVAAWPKDDCIQQVQAQVQGPDDSVYAGGVFTLSVNIPDRYPFEPPEVKFVTPVYHPNIDAQGRICLDLLNMPPKGAWKPSLNISTLLMSVRLLLAEPNPDDGLVQEVTEEFRYRREVFDMKARQATTRHAKPGPSNQQAEDAAAEAALGPSTSGGAAVAAPPQGGGGGGGGAADVEEGSGEGSGSAKRPRGDADAAGSSGPTASDGAPCAKEPRRAGADAVPAALSGKQQNQEASTFPAADDRCGERDQPELASY